MGAAETNLPSHASISLGFEPKYNIIHFVRSTGMRIRVFLSLTFLLYVISSGVVCAQEPTPKQAVRTVTIPISIFTKKELRENKLEEYVQADRLIVHEDKDE